MYDVRKGRKKRSKKEGEREGRREERESDIIWIGFRKDGHRNFTLKLCRQTLYFYVVYSRKEHGRIWIWGDIFIYLFTF